MITCTVDKRGNLVGTSTHGYSLRVDRNPKGTVTDVVFKVTSPVASLAAGCTITARTFDEYIFAFTHPVPFKGSVFVEVGAGLGELVHRVADSFPGIVPVVIDPANYALMEEMLGAALPYAQSPSQINHITRVGQTAAFMQSPRVRLIPHSLDQALRIHPELISSADSVVDYCGAEMYASLASRSSTQVIQQEKTLLAPGGALYWATGFIINP